MTKVEATIRGSRHLTCNVKSTNSQESIRHLTAKLPAMTGIATSIACHPSHSHSDGVRPVDTLDFS